MMNTVINITNDYSILNTTVKYDGIVVSFVIDSIESIEKLSLIDFHASCFLNRNIRFTFFLDFSQNDDDRFIQALINRSSFFLQYFFHPAYFQAGKEPVVCFNEKKRHLSGSDKVVASFNEKVAEQGYKKIHPVYFTHEYSNEKEDCNFVFSDAQSFNDFSVMYYNLLNKQYYVSKYLGVRSNNIDEFLQAINATESKLMNHAPGQYNHLNEFNSLKKSVPELYLSIALIKEDLANQKAYLKIFKEQDETLKIKNFYQNEYEVLPLWYKQFGHILKVLMGKRSFRSLFDNNVKKYNS